MTYRKSKYNSSTYCWINWFVSNKNKTFAINFSLAKTSTHTLNIILVNQIFACAESIKFLGMHLDSNVIMDTPHGKIIKDSEFSMLYDEVLILLSESIQFILHIFSHCSNYG
jgi:hypothetical protein